MPKSSNPVGRREFMKSSAALTSGLLLVKPETAFGSNANSRLDVALLGCGGRGNAVAEDFVKNTNVQVVVLGDLFQDQLDATEQRFNPLQDGMGRSKVKKRFVGPTAYQEVAGSKADIVIIATPPYFHPQHLRAVLDGGHHVYLEKPVSTHVRGCMEVASLAAAAEGKASVDVGFQIRYGSQFVQQTRRLHEGAIGDIALVHGFYFAGDLPRRGNASMSSAERKIRNWVFDRVLGGDIIVEQNIHILDSFNWILGSHPLRVRASADRKVRKDIGDVSDEYTVTLFYPDDVRASFASTQFLPLWGTVGWRCFGPKGFSEAFYSGGLVIKGENPWERQQARSDPKSTLSAMPHR
jgi:myo-inositol 2-dehydrogenase/D-chiro-inositol 1-dehydrogenase